MTLAIHVHDNMANIIIHFRMGYPLKWDMFLKKTCPGPYLAIGQGRQLPPDPA